MDKSNFSVLIPVIIVILLIAAGFSILFIFPKYSEFRSLYQDAQRKEGEVQERERYFARLKEIKKELSNYSSELTKIDTAVPSEPKVLDLLNFVQQVSSQSGLVLQNIGPSKPATSKDIENLKDTQVSLSVEGSYESLKTFLSVLERSARLIDIENVGFSAPQEGSIFSYSLNIKVRSR